MGSVASTRTPHPLVRPRESGYNDPSKSNFWKVLETVLSHRKGVNLTYLSTVLCPVKYFEAVEHSRSREKHSTTSCVSLLLCSTASRVLYNGTDHSQQMLNP